MKMITKDEPSGEGDNPLWQIHQLPFMSGPRCEEIIKKALSSTKWTTKRHTNHPTNDIPVADIEDLDMSDELKEISCLCMDTYGLSGTAVLFDTFVVKYATDGQDKLSMHRDSSEISFVLALSAPTDYEGGGTFYKTHDMVLKANKGDIVFHCGKLEHAGKRVTSGTRFILTGFFNVSSKQIRKATPFETIPNDISDRRYLDYLYSKPRRLEARKEVKLYIKIINLFHRRTKLTDMYERVQNLDVPPNWKIYTDVVIANDGSGQTGYTGWKTDKTFGFGQNVTKYWQREVQAGEIGCTLSHLHATQSVTLLDNEYLLVLEDDATFFSDILFRIDDIINDEVSTNWDLIDLGGVSMDNTFEKLTKYQVDLGYTYQTHCIVYNRHGLDKLRKLIIGDRIIAYDEFLSVLRGKSGRGDLKELCSEMELLYGVCPYERLSTQCGTVHDTETVQVISKEPSPSSMFARVKDDYDMRNFFKFSSIRFDDRAPSPEFALMANANKCMWQFGITNVSAGGYVNHSEFTIFLTASIKLVGVHLTTSESSVTFQTNNRTVNTQYNFVVFPSYLAVRVIQCPVFFAHGSPFF